MGKNREELFADVFDVTYNYFQYATLYERLAPNYYGYEIRETESYTILNIGDNPGITATEISGFLNITLAATSKLIRKMRDKKWVEQVRNEKNNRVYNLYLTDEGRKVYDTIKKAYEECCEMMTDWLDEFTDEELEIYSRIMKKIYISQLEYFKNG